MEDAKYITEILLEKQKYALIREVIFYYRTRKSGESVLQTVAQSRSWYYDTPKYVFKYLFHLSKEKFGYIIPYIQYLVMYELQWRLKTPLPDSFCSEEIVEYRNCIVELLREIDDFVIWEQRNLWREFKLFALSLKYNRPIGKELTCCDETLRFHNIQIYPKRTRAAIEISIVDVIGESIYIEGRFAMALQSGDYSLIAKNKGNSYEMQLFQLDESMKRFSLGEMIHEIIGFRVKVPLNTLENNSIAFYLQYRGASVRLGFHFSFICKLTQDASEAFWHCGDYILKPQGTAIQVYPYTRNLVRRFEKALDKELFKTKRYRLLCWRWLIIFMNLLLVKRKPIWLILDGFAFAGDNGEFFFRYLMQHKNQNIRPYFVIDEKSKDYDRLKAIGPVIPADTKKYRLLFALADKVISSQSFYNVQNTFYKRTALLQDLFHFDFVYLQHGVIKDNHADTQSRHKKDFSLFITSAEKEKDSIIKGIGGNYCYDEKIVKVTGLARHDYILPELTRISSRKILLAPTWRKEGVGTWNEQKQTYSYSESFRNTKFYQFYQSLMCDPRILEALDKNGYTMVVRLHPRTIQQAADFIPGKHVTLEYERQAYVEEVKSTALLVTDYSSIAFDYAYSDVPVIYTQYDKDTFYMNHGYKRGYFDYETMGFGPVCYEYESTVNAIVAAMESVCVMEKKYQQRVEEFFAYRDGKNCERIYSEILKLDKEK